jgi:hypothetical protein
MAQGVGPEFKPQYSQKKNQKTVQGQGLARDRAQVVVA